MTVHEIDEASVDPGTESRSEPEPGPAAVPAGRDAGRRWSVPTIALVLLLVAALAAAVMQGRRWYEHRQLEDAHAAAVAAARQITVDFMSISASTVDRDLQRIMAAATGEFKEEFTRGMPQARAVVVENDVQSQGTVLRAGLVSGDLDSAVVLVAIDTTVRNAGAPDGRLSHYRLQADMNLDKASGKWLMSRLQFVG